MIDKCIKILCIYVLIYTVEYYSAKKKKEILLFLMTWINPEVTMPSERSQTGKDKYHMISLTYRI